MSTTIYIFTEKQEKYQYFLVENSTLSGAMVFIEKKKKKIFYINSLF